MLTQDQADHPPLRARDAARGEKFLYSLHARESAKKGLLREVPVPDA